MQLRDVYSTTTRHFLGPVIPLLDDESVSEIMINGHDAVYYEQGGKIQASEFKFPNEASLLAAARNIGEYVNREVGGLKHSMDARLPDGSRVHVIVPPSCHQGVCITIRKFSKATFDLARLVEWGSLSAEAAEFLEIAVLLHKNMIIAGGTGTGKTSMLNALSAAIPATERIVVIEDSSELQLRQPHTVYLEAQPPQPDGRGEVTIRDLFVDSLRMRPDRIVVGEVRRGEALDLIQSMISGHPGSLTTLHANTPRDAAIRLETLCLMSDVSLPVYVARAQVASAINLVVQIARMSDGTRRVTTISECLGLDEHNNYQFVDLYRFRAEGKNEQGKLRGRLEWTGDRPQFAQDLQTMGYMDRVRLTNGVFGEHEQIAENR